MRQDLDIKTSYALIKFFKELQQKEKVYNETINTLLEKFGVKEGQGYIIPKENEEGANIEFKSLVEIEEEYTFDKIKLPE